MCAGRAAVFANECGTDHDSQDDRDRHRGRVIIFVLLIFARTSTTSGG